MSPAGRSSPQPRFQPIGFQDLPGWTEDDHKAALAAFQLSCPKLVSALKAGNAAGPLPTPSDLIRACEAARALTPKLSRADARSYFEQHFEPHRIVHDRAEGLLTGYYEPQLEGSRTPTERFQTPLHRRPADLVNIVDETQRGAVGAALTHARKTHAGLVPFATRAEISAGALNGQGLEFVYLADPVDVFFLQVQGSGRIRLTDGDTIRVHYDGKNGHPYTSIGRYLIDQGLLAADRMSMGALGRWLRSDPQRARRVMNQNASYVFFRELPRSHEAPLGVLGIPLTTGRSLAVDASVTTLGLPVYVVAPTLTRPRNGKPFQRLMIAQDVGSAIRGAERGDIYFGSGETAGRLAGVTRHPGNLYQLRPRASVGIAKAKADGSR